MRTGELLRYTITCWPTRRQNVVPLSRLPIVSAPPDGAGFPLLQVRVSVGLALPVPGATPLADGLDA
jgi:hypothetical protein